MKFLSLEGLTEYTTNLLNKIRTMMSAYIPLSGSTEITGELRSYDEIQSTAPNAFRLANPVYGTILRNDGTNTYVLLTNKDDTYGSWNNLRPLTIDNATGAVSFNNGIHGNLTGNATNADTVDGFHAYEIQTKNNDGSLFTDEKNTAYIQWDGSNYFWLKAPLNATAVNHSESSDRTNSISSTGFGDTSLTYYQSGEEFYDRTGWCHYLIANHGSGESYYNYVVGLPFWGSPIYRRQDGNPNNRTEWHKFHTTETITYGTSSLVVGTAVLPEGHIYLQYE